MDWTTLTAPVIIAVVPAVLAYGKRLVGAHTWLIPPIAAALGVVADFLVAYASNAPTAPGTGAVLGLAGVGLREAVDQMRKATNKA